MVEIIAVVISGISLLIVIINQFKMIKDKEPQLSFNLRSINGFLYLKVRNSGLTKAKNIRITIIKIYNNGDSGIQEDQIFQIPFELAAQEEVQGMIGFLNESISNHPFPYVDIKVCYDKPHFIKRVKYERQVFYYASVEEKLSVDTGLDLRSIDHNINNIHKSTLRLANYFDGNEIAPFDELNIVSGNHFQKDLKNVKEGKNSTVKSRKEVIESRIR